MADVTSNEAWWQYGAIGAMLVAFAFTIRYLFKRYESREDKITAEREAREASITAERNKIAEERVAWATEREAIHAAQSEELRRQAEVYAQELRDERDANRTHEDAVRKEFAEIMGQVENEASRASAALVQTLEKFYDRFIGPKARY